MSGQAGQDSPARGARGAWKKLELRDVRRFLRCDVTGVRLRFAPP